MHMIDVMKKLQEIAEAGYDNEDIQRGIDAAGIHKVSEDETMEGKSQGKAWYREQEAHEMAKKDGKDWSRMTYGDKEDYRAKVKAKNEDTTTESDENDILEDADIEEVHEDEVVDESRMGFKDLDKLGRENASKVDHEARRQGSADMEPGDADRLRYKVAKELGLVEAVEEGGFNKDGSYQTSDDEANEFDDEDDDSEEIATETVEINVNELAELMQLAGYTDYAEKIEEYANEPEEKYMDAEEQLIGLSGGLNGPKKMYPAAAGGDNPMDQEPREVTESTFESFYKKYDKFVAELKDSE